MTRQSQNEHERFYVERAAEILRKKWILGPDRECPDFIVTEGTQRFGLELCEIFTGPQSQAGSGMKKMEAETQRAVDDRRCEYEAITKIPLIVKLVGDVCADNMAAVVPALVAKDLSTRSVGHHDVIEVGDRLRVHVTRANVANWFSVNDRVGWVDRYPIKTVTDAIKNKSMKLPRYREAAGPDIRLLLVADRICNSGKLMLEEGAALDVRGFQIVYFFSYPESVTVFDHAGNPA